MKKSLLIFKTELIQMFRQTKILMLVFFLVMLYESIFSPMRSVCDETGFTLHPVEPFILLCTKSTNIILIPIIYLFLLGQFPHCKKQYFQMIRTGKQRWFWGELAFIAASSLLIVLVTLAGSEICMFDKLETTGRWSLFMTQMNAEFPELYAQNHLLFLDASIVAHGTPYAIMLYEFGLIWIYLVIIGTFVIYGTIIGKRAVTMIAAIAITVIGGSAIYLDGKLKWVFPLVHIEYGLHYNSLFSQAYFPVWGSILYLVLLLGGLTALCLASMKKMRIGNEQ